VQHHPYVVVFIQANLNKVISGAEGAQLLFGTCRRTVEKLVILLFQNGLESAFQRLEANLVDCRRALYRTKSQLIYMTS
jgi:hypothetical protein